MTAPTNNPAQPGVVQQMRGIREQLSREIKDMTFEQERAYLDRLLAEAAAASDQPRPAKSVAAWIANLKSGAGTAAMAGLMARSMKPASSRRSESWSNKYFLSLRNIQVKFFSKTIFKTILIIGGILTVFIVTDTIDILAKVILGLLAVAIIFALIIFFSNHTIDEKFNKEYKLYLDKVNGTRFFFYNNRKSSLAFVREHVLPLLGPSIQIVFVSGKKIEAIEDIGFISQMLYEVEEKKGFPYLLKVIDGQVHSCSINNQFYGIMANKKPLTPLIKRINSFYNSSTISV